MLCPEVAAQRAALCGLPGVEGVTTSEAVAQDQDQQDQDHADQDGDYRPGHDVAPGSRNSGAVPHGSSAVSSVSSSWGRPSVPMPSMR